jgi:hypothetical protein
MTTPATPRDDRFTEFMRKLVSVPHSEIKARLEAEKAEKKSAPPRKAGRKAIA